MSDRDTYAYRERRAKLLLRQLIKAETRRRRQHAAQVAKAKPSVASRFEAGIVADGLADLKTAQAWLEQATIPRRIR